MFFLRYLPALLGLTVVACTTLPPSPPVVPPPAAQYQSHLAQINKIRFFAMNGRMAIMTESKGFSGGLHWHHHGEGDDLDFFSPLGTQLGKLTRDADGVTLTTSTQNSIHANDAETLTQQTLGWSLPMSGLTDWILGRPAQGPVEVLASDVKGNITHMMQQGWDIHYADYADFNDVTLPVKITLKSQKLDLKLVIESWQTGAE